jgi:hypothetical protein
VTVADPHRTEVHAHDAEHGVHELSEALSHHLDEEERTILNPAREELDEDVRESLGAAFAASRRERLDADCGDIEVVRALVARAERRGD